MKSFVVMLHMDSISISYNRYWKPSQKYIPAFAKKSFMHWLHRYFLIIKIVLIHLRNWVDGKNLFWGGATAFSDVWKQKLFVQDGHFTNNPDPIS